MHLSARESLRAYMGMQVVVCYVGYVCVCFDYVCVCVCVRACVWVGGLILGQSFASTRVSRRANHSAKPPLPRTLSSLLFLPSSTLPQPPYLHIPPELVARAQVRDILQVCLEQEVDDLQSRLIMAVGSSQ